MARVMYAKLTYLSVEQDLENEFITGKEPLNSLW